MNTNVLSCLSEKGVANKSQLNDNIANVQQANKVFSIRPNYCNKGNIDWLNPIDTEVGVYYGCQWYIMGMNTY